MASVRTFHVRTIHDGSNQEGSSSEKVRARPAGADSFHAGVFRPKIVVGRQRKARIPEGAAHSSCQVLGSSTSSTSTRVPGTYLPPGRYLVPWRLTTRRVVVGPRLGFRGSAEQAQDRGLEGWYLVLVLRGLEGS